MYYVSDVVDISRLERTSFNLVSSATGTGKTYWVGNELLNAFPEIKPSEVLFVTSRAIIVDQQAKSGGNIHKYNRHDKRYVEAWSGLHDSPDYLKAKGIPIMTYDKLIDILNSKNIEGLATLGNVKIVVFDECHTIFSDTFIQDIGLVKLWIRDLFYTEDEYKKYIIGMTATPGIIEWHQREWGVPIRRINENILVNYKAKQLHCTDFDTIPYIITTNQIVGKTIVMCYSIKDCYKLKSKIPNSAVLVSRSSQRYMPEMDRIRNTIVNGNTIPDTYMEVTERNEKTKKPIKWEERKLEVLITTSTLREGINLHECSGIRNVICCFSDELHIIQFAGRLRYSFDNLIIADTYIRTDNFGRNSYLHKCRESFKRFMDSDNNADWFTSIAHIVEHDIYGTLKFVLGAQEKKFIEYVNGKWLMPSDVSEKEKIKYMIYKKEDKEEIINKVHECKLFDLVRSRLTFMMVIRLMRDTLGYTIESNRKSINNKQFTYKLVMDYDACKVTYKPPKEKNFFRKEKPEE